MMAAVLAVLLRCWHPWPHGLCASAATVAHAYVTPMDGVDFSDGFKKEFVTCDSLPVLLRACL